MKRKLNDSGKNSGQIFFMWSPHALSPTPFLASPFFCCIFLGVFLSCSFLVLFFSVIFSFFFSFFFCIVFQHTDRNNLKTLDLQYSEIYIIGHLVVLFLFFYLSACSEREKYNAMH